MTLKMWAGAHYPLSMTGKEAQSGVDLANPCSYAQSSARDRLKIGSYRTLRSGLLTDEPVCRQSRRGCVARYYSSALGNQSGATSYLPPMES